MPLTSEQYSEILKLLESSDYDGTCSHVVNSFSDNFKPEPISDDVEISENFGETSMLDLHRYGVIYVEITNKSVKRIDPRDIKINNDKTKGH